MNQMNLPKVWLRRVDRDTGAMLHRLPAMRIPFHTKTGEKFDMVLTEFRERVRRAGTHENNAWTHQASLRDIRLKHCQRSRWLCRTTGCGRTRSDAIWISDPTQVTQRPPRIDPQLPFDPPASQRQLLCVLQPLARSGRPAEAIVAFLQNHKATVRMSSAISVSC